MMPLSCARMRLIGLLAMLALSTQAIAAERVRIAVFGLFHAKQLVVEALPSQPLNVAADGRQITLSNSGLQRLVFTKSGEEIVMDRANRKTTATQINIAAQQSGDDADFVLSVPGKLHRQFHGRLIIASGENELLPVVEMDLEIAVGSIVAAESLPGAPLEALKAQAVVSRSYLLAGGPRHAYADFCDTTHCQFIRRPPAPSSPAARATAETTGLVLAWQSKTFAAMYSASCGGRTRTLAEAGYVAHDYPYFAVECLYCRRSPERWSSKVAASDARELSQKRDEHARIRAGRKLGWAKVPSSAYDMKREDDGAFELSGVGRGHGIGLCELGAADMARDGKDFRAILAHYFPNTTVQSKP